MAALALWAALAGSAAAGTNPGFGPRDTARAQSVAAAAWGNPCAGRVAVQWIDLPPGYAAEAVPLACVVQFNRTQFFTWRAFCSVMAHEYGNLAGVPETSPTEPWRLTSSHYDAWRYPYRGCVPRRHPRRRR